MFKWCVSNSFVTVYFVDLYFKLLYPEWDFSWGFWRRVKVEAETSDHHKRAGNSLQTAISKQENPKHIAFTPCQMPLPGALRKARGVL